MKKLKKYLNHLTDIFFPKFCVVCKKQGYLLCPDCLSLLEIMEYKYCPFCRKRVLGQEGKCSRHHSAQLNGLYFATPYNNIIIKTTIQKFKYQPFLKELSQPLSQLIITHLHLVSNDAFLKENSVLIPVPLYKSREKWRGFNQAEELAKHISRHFNIPLEKEVLLKTKKTKEQVRLKKAERARNIIGAFQIKHPQRIKDKGVFLVDDVFTTGSTMEECARVLKQSGAKEVWGITVAREIEE